MPSGYRRGSGDENRRRPGECLPVPSARTLGERLPVVRPKAGTYPIRAFTSDGVTQAPGWNPPTDNEDWGTSLGRGPMQFLGCFDTMPDLVDYDDAMRQNLRPDDMPGGATLRFSMPRPLRYSGPDDTTEYKSAVAPAMRYPAGLVLYVAGVDVLPAGWKDDPLWPGLPAGYVGDISYVAGQLTSQWSTDLQAPFNNDPGGAPTQETFGPGGYADGVRYLAHHVARPMLDLLGYVGGPGAEADLGELAGGHRYVAAWLQFWWTRYDGVDPFENAAHDVVWTVQAGRPANAGHRNAWHLTIPVVGPDLNNEAALAAEGKAFGIASPIAGTWRVSITSNGSAADSDVFVGLEIRNGGLLERDTTAVAYNEHGVPSQLSPATRHGGAAVVLAGYDNANATPIAALVSISVVP